MRAGKAREAGRPDNTQQQPQREGKRAEQEEEVEKKTGVSVRWGTNKRLGESARYWTCIYKKTYIAVCTHMLSFKRQRPTDLFLLHPTNTGTLTQISLP